ncbi:MAG: DNA cytosine methyltransferase [Desulfobacterales bacterium]
MNYYNDNDKFCSKWLKDLIKAKLIPCGEVDDRSIKEISPKELQGYKQCHFFAGIGGWAYALRLAGWPEDKPVWTGSCPCQPFSIAGKGQGVNDNRHLWPAFRWLISQCRPATIFGEQVASKAGREWLSGIRLDLEAMGYVFGAADLCSAGVGAPNIRQRLFWVADAKHSEWRKKNATGHQHNRKDAGREKAPGGSAACGSFDIRLANYESERFGKTRECIGGQAQGTPWSKSTDIECRDGKRRRIPIEPALSPLAPGLPKRVGLLRGAGNSINPWVAKIFIEAFMDWQPR